MPIKHTRSNAYGYMPIRVGQNNVTGNGMCLEVPSGIKDNNISLVAVPCNGRHNQMFRWNDEYGLLKAKHSRKCVHWGLDNSLKQVSCKKIKTRKMICKDLANKKRNSKRRRTHKKRQ